MKPPLTKDEFNKQFIPFLENPQPLTITAASPLWWFALSAIQLAVRHPGLHDPLISQLTTFARHIQSNLNTILPPDLQALLESGWDPSADVDDNGDPLILDDFPDVYDEKAGVGVWLVPDPADPATLHILLEEEE